MFFIFLHNNLQLLVLALYHYESGYTVKMKVTLVSSYLLLLHNNLQLLVLALYHYEPGYKDESYPLIFLSSLPPQQYPAGGIGSISL